MAGIKGPAVFLAQFLRDTPPFNSLENICKWFAELGYAGVQIPGWDRRVIDIDLAATSVAYCDELKGKLAALGLSVTEIPAYLAGQVLAIHPAYEVGFAGFHPPGLRGAARTEWAAAEVRKCIDASAKARPTQRASAVGRICVAHDLSLAAAPAGSHRRSLQGTRSPLAADSRLRA